jgi:hypothetical protein
MSENDDKADAWAAVLLIAVFVGGLVFWLSSMPT